MITIIGALKGELQPLLSHFKPEKKKNINGGSLYIAKGVHLLRCGIGKKVCQKVLTAYLENYHPNLIINIGTAGIVNPEIKQGEIFSVVKNYQNGNDNIFELMAIKGFKSASLLTVDKPLRDKKLRDSYFRKYRVDLVDMEGWYCAQSATQCKADFHSIKIASDFADENTEKDFMKNYKALTEKLAVEIIPVLF
jgi:nucleoside phosphorylase